MPNFNTAFDTTLLKSLLPQLLQKVDLSALLSLLKSKVVPSPEHYVDKTVKQLNTLRDQKLRVANMLGFAIDLLENTDFSKFSPLNVKNFARPKLNLSTEEVLDKTIDFLTTLKNYTGNKPDSQETFSNGFRPSNVNETAKNNIPKNETDLNLEDFVNNLSGILEKLKGMNNK